MQKLCLLLALVGIALTAPTITVLDMEEVPGLVEGDMILGIRQMNGLIDPTLLWPNATVTYELDSNFTPDEITKIKAGWQDISDTTCITFRERTTEKMYVFVRRGGENSGCASAVGMQSPGQILNYEPKCIDRHGTITHEMLHTLGFFHEQSRPDRDDYVEIVRDKIKPGRHNNFIKHSTEDVTTFGAPYDYGSVLHYSGLAFSVDGSPTIIPKIPGVVIGQRVKISQIDSGKAMLMYKCPTNGNDAAQAWKKSTSAGNRKSQKSRRRFHQENPALSFKRKNVHIKNR